MPYKVIIEKKDKYIRFNLFNIITKPEIDSAMNEIKVIRQKHKLDRVLCDQRQLQMRPSDTVGFQTAVQFGSPSYRGIKVAIIRRDVKEERLFEIAARNRGLIVKIFEDEEEAKKWLLKE